VLAAGGVVAGGALAVELASAEGAREVPSGIGPLSLRATARLEPRRADLVVVPGAAGRLDGGEAARRPLTTTGWTRWPPPARSRSARASSTTATW
jgi:hypothetical protein